MSNLLRRVAALTVVSIAGIGLLSPLSARSLVPERTETVLLDLPLHPAESVQRGETSARLATTTTLATSVGEVAETEPITAADIPDRSGSVPLVATIQIAPPEPPPPPRQPPAPAAVEPPPVAAQAAVASAGSVSGRASYYCCTLGFRGQAVVSLPAALGGAYTGGHTAYVTVCADRCVRLPVVDQCGCYWGTPSQRVADLSREAWAAVSDAPFSQGLLPVTLHLEG